MNHAEINRRQAEALADILTWITLLVIGRLIGSNGVTYIVAAYGMFMLIWLPVGGGLADSLGRLLRNRNNKGQYKNAEKMRSFAMLLQVVLGAAGSLLLFVVAQPAAEVVFKVRYSALILMVLSPAVCLRSISTVLMGYFQGEGSELPTATAGILRQLFILGFGCLFAGCLKEYGTKVSGLLQQQNFTAMYSGAGIALAVTSAEILIVLFLFVLYRGSSRRKKRTKPESGMRTTDSSMDCFRSLYGSRWSGLLTGLLAFLPFPVGWLLYGRTLGEEDTVSLEYGIYVGKYLVVCGIIVSLITIVALPVIGKGLASLRKEEHRFARAAFQSGIHLCVVHGIFASVFIGVMGEQLAGLLCPDSSDIALKMFRGGAAVILFSILSSYLVKLLLAMNKKYVVLGGYAVGNVVFAISTALLLKLGKLGILAVVYGGLTADGVFCILLGVLACRQLRLRVDWLRMLVMPLAAGAAAGLVNMLLKGVFAPHLGNLVTIIVMLVISGAVYWALLLLTRDFREQELEFIPGGKIIGILGQMLHVF